jgi:hypothetical protein
MSMQAVSKGAFSRNLRRAAANRETGLFTIVTDSERSVLLRISDGRITSSRCRGREIDKAIAVLEGSKTLRFSFAPAAAESHPELIGIAEFLLRIGASVDSRSENARRPQRRRGRASSSSAPMRPGEGDTSVRGTLEELAVDAIGPVAQVVVDEALANNATVQEAIREIAWAIPDTEVATRFLEVARERIPDIEGEF